MNVPLLFTIYLSDQFRASVLLLRLLTEITEPCIGTPPILTTTITRYAYVPIVGGAHRSVEITFHEYVRIIPFARLLVKESARKAGNGLFATNTFDFRENLTITEFKYMQCKSWYLLSFDCKQVIILTL